MSVEGLHDALGDRADVVTLPPGAPAGLAAHLERVPPRVERRRAEPRAQPERRGGGHARRRADRRDIQLLDSKESTHLPRDTVYVEPFSGEVVPAQVYRRRKGNHAGKPSGRYKTVVLERAYRAGWEVYESLCRGTVDSAGNPLTFG